MNKLTNIEYWKAITLLGLNVTTYKPALAKNILFFAKMGISNIKWDDFFILPLYSSSYISIFK